jgi:hypothetical protein
MGMLHNDVGIVEAEFKKDEMDWECGTYREKKISYRLLAWKREG